MSELAIKQYNIVAKKENVVKSIRDVLEPYKIALDVSLTPRWFYLVSNNTFLRRNTLPLW